MGWFKNVVKAVVPNTYRAYKDGHGRWCVSGTRYTFVKESQAKAKCDALNRGSEG